MSELEPKTTPERNIKFGVSWMKNKAARAVVALGVLGLWASYSAKNFEENKIEPISPPATKKSLKGETDQKFSPTFSAELDIKTLEGRQSLLEAIKEGNVGYQVYARDLFPEDNNGDTYINYSALISPVGVALEEVVPNKKAEIMTEVPYEYAREFDLARELNPEDSERLKDFLVQEMRDQMIKDQIAGLDSKNVYFNAKEEELMLSLNPREREGIDVKNLKVIGSASPEGPREKGSKTVSPGTIDSENIELGQMRAEHSKPAIKDALKEVLEGNDRVINNLEVVGTETQFTAMEWDELDSIARRLGFDNPTQEARVFSMIVDFNDGEIKDQHALERLQDIIASKRTVILQVEYTDDQKEIFAIPIPLLALLAAMPWLKIRRKRETQPSQLSSKYSSSSISRELEPGKEIISKGSLDVGIILPEDATSQVKMTEPEPELATKNEIIDDTTWHNVTQWWNRESLEKSRTIAFTIYQDIEPSWGKELVLVEDNLGQRLISYQSLMTERFVELEFSKLTPEERGYEIKNLTEEILFAWEQHDKAVAIEAGIDSLTVESSFRDYYQEEEQIRWGRAHAEVLMATAEAKKEYEQKRQADPTLPEKNDIDFLIEASKKLTKE